MRVRSFLVAVLFLSSAGCASVARTLSFGSCAVADERLSVALTAPETAVEWLEGVSEQVQAAARRVAAGEALSDEDAQALQDASDVLARLRGCVET